MIVKFGHVLVDDQDKALRFYTETLGFVKKRDVPDGEVVMGFPAVPDKQAKRQIIAVQHLPELMRRMRDLEKQVAELKAKVGDKLEKS